MSTWINAAGEKMEYLAPTTTCTSNAVPCQKGNNPMITFHEYQDPFPVKKCKDASAGAGAVASVTINATDPDAEKRNHLESRARDIFYFKREEIGNIFFIDEPDGPRTAKELKQRLAKGLYTVTVPKNENDEDDEYCCGFYWRDAFSWRTPDTMADRKGHKAALEAFNKFYADQMDIIKIGSPTEGLEALKLIQEWKPKK